MITGAIQRLLYSTSTTQGALQHVWGRPERVSPPILFQYSQNQLTIPLGSVVLRVDTRSMRRALLFDRETTHTEPRTPKRGAKSPSWLPMLYRNGKFYRVDLRSREGILLRDTTNALIDQLNRKPSAAEKMLIERLAWLHLCITSLDQRVLSGTVDYDEATAYASHINSFSMGLSNLGLLGDKLNLPSLSASHPSTESLSAERRERRTAQESFEP
jgi:hypothetical protein